MKRNFNFVPVSLKISIAGLYRRHIVQRFFPERIIDELFVRNYGRHFDPKNPVNICEKINWLKLHSDMDLWARLADKYAVRQYVAEKGHGDILTELYGVYRSADDIDFDALPQAFVIKTNNRSGDTRIVRDKAAEDLDALREEFRRLMATPFGDELYEMQYRRIKPRIVVEQLLDNREQPIPSSSLVDYKIWCFSGRPHCIEVYFNRTKEGVETQVYDTDWNLRKGVVKTSVHYRGSEQSVPRPRDLERMLAIASDLAGDLPQARVDLYNTEGRIYFGEITLTTAGGFMRALSDEFLEELGNQCRLQ